ncbi:MAG: signal transduction histidine kinase [Pseudomonadales bacterium]|jgi:signal transduction histidine kinase|uniref:ATP-binding protein n=1 Tax=Marinobacter maritimus TaxID=277961 RepID=UPI0011A70EF9|nr:ATP-binding protein [Marinobacter maritimus]|tara:strand:+ start:895 stop:2343 length:1449 start_codon:yes stop_codon:yes gene_type:complete
MGRWRWRYWPLKAKLLFPTLFTSTLGIVLVCASLIVVENENYREQLESELQVIAGILAEQSAAALLFEDHEQLSNIISSLRKIETIKQACVFNASGVLMSALYSSDDTSCTNMKAQPELGFVGDYYRLSQPVTLYDDTVGLIYLISHLEVLKAHIRTFIFLALGIGVLIQLILVFVAFKLQRVVSHPILELSGAAERISLAHDYTIRAPVYGNDELGRLGTTFNDMIGTIEQQNRRILESRDGLERIVEHRTSQLSLANKELEAFSYSVSHDLRQPLRAIEGFGRALEEDCERLLDETGKDHLRRIRAASVRMGGLIDGLLVLSRVSRQPMESKRLNLSEMLQDIAEELIDLSKPLPTEVHIQPDIWVVGDGRMLRIAFQNLLENAWKYSAKEQVRLIEVSATSGADYITIAIQDNGVGFDMRYIDKLFVAFNRLHTPSEFGGTGIGLATVNRVILRHHGKISASSEVGEGARFCVSLPVGD